MARQLPQPPPSSNIDTVNLTRLLNRLEHNVLSPSADTKSLRSSAHRARVTANLEYARTLLLRLEHTSSSIKIQSRKQATQADLLKKRELIKRLNERLYEYSQADDDDEASDSEDASSGEDLLGEDGDLQATATNTIIADPEPLDRRRSHQYTETDTTSTLRSRHTNASSTQTATTTSASLFSQSQPPKHTSTSSTLTSNTHTQEAMTDSLLDMAIQLKAQSVGFHNSLESEKSILSHTTEGLDRNASGMEIAGKKMGVLKRMSEGKGWLGRMMLYAWIAGLLAFAILLVFAGPKFRF